MSMSADPNEAEVAKAVGQLADVQEQIRYTSVIVGDPANVGNPLAGRFVADLNRLTRERATLIRTLARLVPEPHRITVVQNAGTVPASATMIGYQADSVG